MPTHTHASITDRPTNPPFTISLVESTKGPLCKEYSFESETLKTSTSAYLTRGMVEQITFDSLVEFMEWRSQLAPHQAVILGVTSHQRADVVTKRSLAGIPAATLQSDKIVARAREYFAWPTGPGLAMLDADDPIDIPAGVAARLDTSPEGLRNLVVEIFPALGHAPIAWAPSSSSCIWVNEEQVQGIRGQRFYVPLHSGLQVPDFADHLREQLILRDLFWVMVSKSGQRLIRFPFDFSVYQPERLDFAASPICNDPVSRRPLEPRIWNAGEPYLDLAELPDTSAGERREIDAAIDRKRRAKAGQARVTQEEWIGEVGRRIALSRPNVDMSEGREVARRAVERGVLGPDYLLTDSEGVEVSVGELLADPERNHGRHFHDPFEPDYRGDPRIAVFLSNRDGGVIYSHAHGGQTWRCVSKTVTIVTGLIHETVDEIKDALAVDSAGLFRSGSGIVCLDEASARMRSLGGDGLAYHIQSRFDVGRISGGTFEPKDLQKRIISALESEACNLPLPVLASVVKGPFAREDGSIVDTTGYDPASQVYYLSQSASPLRARKALSVQDANEALCEFWKPFSEFCFASAVDRGAALAAALTCLSRDALEIAPGYLLNASTAGAGKTTLANTLGALQTGRRVPVTSLPEGDDELRKQLFAAVRAGECFMILDNAQRGSVIDSPYLAQHITSAIVSSRPLHTSNYEQRPNRMVLVITGNNVSLKGDMNRRMLTIRLDAGMERPWTRSFPFDPVKYVLARWERQRILGLELIAAAMKDQGEPLDEAAGFPDWDGLVRRTVLWIMDNLDSDVEFADPAVAMQESYDDDTEREVLADLLTSLHEVFGSQWFSTRAVEDIARTARSAEDAWVQGETEASTAEARLLLARKALSGSEYTDSNPAELGRYLTGHDGRIVDGLSLERGGKTNGRRRYRVTQALAVAGNS